MTPAESPLDALPSPSARRLAVRITPAALREVRRGSPWVYDGSITSATDGGSTGDLAVIFDEQRKFAAIGLWDAESPIRVKVLHHGAPATIDGEWWRWRVMTALERRSTLSADPDTTAYRCIHGENDGFPGLVVDRYDRTLVAKLYSSVWFANVAPVLESLVGAVDPERVVVRLSRALRRGETFGLADGTTVLGQPRAGPVLFRERGLTMEADVVHGQKTGHFLDQRDNRALVRSMSTGANVLDVFASTGGFSVSAAAGGARGVHLVDVSEHALHAAERNLAHNRHIRAVRECSVRITTGDAFDVMKRLGKRDERYDVVVVDPPSFAGNQASVERALRAYARLTEGAVQLVAPDGMLVQASCSSRVSSDEFFGAVRDAALRARVELHEIRRTGQPLDHPIGFEQGAYLKALFARVERSRRASAATTR